MSAFFGVVVAVAIVLYGFKSGAALAAVMGVAIEVLAMLSPARMVNNTKARYEKAL